MVWGARAPPIAGYCHHVFYFTLFSQHFHSKKASQSPSRPPSTAFFRICRPVGTGAQGTRGFCRTGQSPAVEPCTRAPQSFLGAGLQASDFIGCSSEKSLGIGPMRPTNRVTCRLNIEKSPFESQTKTVEYMRFPWHFGESLTSHRCLLCG